MTAFSLFSGIAGGDLGMEQAGMECVGQCEIEAFPRRVLERHYPGVPRYTDVREVTGAEFDGADLCIFGSPCQDLSVAGRRAGLAGERSGLFFEAVRVLERARPRWVVFENVPGLLSSNGGRDFLAVLDSLGQLGYGLAWAVLDAQHFGVPQRRRRVFVVGCLGEPERAIEVLSEPDGGPRHPAAGGTPGTDIAHALRASTRGVDEPTGTTYVSNAVTARCGRGVDSDCTTTLAPTLRTNNRNNSNGGTEARMLVAHALTAEGHDASEDGTGRGTPIVAFNWQSGGSKARLGVGDKPTALSANQTPAILEHVVRRLTPTECERLQGFPDGWTAVDGDKTPDSPRYRALGNAMAVPVVRWIGERILAAAGGDA